MLFRFALWVNFDMLSDPLTVDTDKCFWAAVARCHLCGEVINVNAGADKEQVHDMLVFHIIRCAAYRAARAKGGATHERSFRRNA